MKTKFGLFVILLSSVGQIFGQTLSETQRRNARATGYAIVAARNPGLNFSIYVIPWDGVNTLEYNAHTQINSGWNPQAVVKGNFFNQTFNGSDFSQYSSVILSQQDFDVYKSTGTQWWIVCSNLPSFSGTLKASVNGNVGIGTATPGSFKLAVAGKIAANEEVRVFITGTTVFPDYVFDPSYELPKLEETEKYIKENRHLPEVPSAADVEKNGMSLNDMNIILLKKVEELTLYMIEMNKENEILKLRLDNLEKKK